MADEGSWNACPTLGVHDVRGAVKHLVERFGFEEVTVLDGVVADEGAVYGIVKRNGAELHLQIRRRPLRGGDRESIEGDVYFRVTDADAVHGELVEHGAEIFRALQDSPYGMRDFTAQGPEGYRFTFGSPLTG